MIVIQNRISFGDFICHTTDSWQVVADASDLGNKVHFNFKQ